jgi:hypothetical protein
LDDFAQTPDDEMSMLTIGARMLNVTNCPGSGEATARFLAVLVQRLQLENTADSRRVLQFVRSPAFMNLASSDITTSYFNDDSMQPITGCGASATASQRTQTSVNLPPLATPSNADPRNHATYWGEQSAWNDSKNDLFRELRGDDYRGWIHVATWELADACVDMYGKKRANAKCTPIRVHYTSTPFEYTEGKAQLASPFWLGRARFLRDAPPHIYEHQGDAEMQQRGRLGHVIGVVEYGECVRPLGAPSYYDVSTVSRQRRFVHVWIDVGPANLRDCFGP